MAKRGGKKEPVTAYEQVMKALKKPRRETIEESLRRVIEFLKADKEERKIDPLTMLEKVN